MTDIRKTPEAGDRPDDLRMTAELPTARVEISHRNDAATGEEIVAITLRAQPSVDAAMGLLGPAAMASLFSASAPTMPMGFLGISESGDQGWAFSAGRDPMTVWTHAWSQWAQMWMQPFGIMGAPTMCGPKTKKSD